MPRFSLSFTILFILLVYAVHGQTLDSLKRVLDAAKTEDQKIKALQKIGRHLYRHDTTAVSYYKQLIEIGTRRKDKILLAITYNSIGTTWYYAKDLKRSSQAYYTGIEFTEDTPEFYRLRTQFYNNLGWNYTQFQNPKKALGFYLQAEKYARLSNDELTLAHVLNNKGVSQFNLKEYTASLKTLTESLRLNRKLKIPQRERFNLNNIGKTLIYLDRLRAAEDTLQKVLTLNLIAGDTLEVVSNMINLNTIYRKEKEYTKAIKILLNALELAPSVKAKTKIEVYKDLSRLFIAKNDYRNASFYQARYIALNDSVDNLKFHEYSLELDRRYSNAMQDRDLEQAKKELAEQRLYITVILSAFLLLLFGAAFLWYSFILKKRNESLLIGLNNEIAAHAEELRQANDSIQAINQNLESIVENRTKIIKEQNKRLLQFGFMNSHEIRGPIATLMGLINLLQDSKTREDQVTLISYLKNSSIKLDTVVRNMTKQLEKEGLVMSEE